MPELISATPQMESGMADPGKEISLAVELSHTRMLRLGSDLQVPSFAFNDAR